MATSEMINSRHNVEEDGWQYRPGDEAVHAGLTVILADAARSHLQAGDLDKATRCLNEAARCLAFVGRPGPAEVSS